MFTMEDLLRAVEEERVSCVQDIEHARLQGSSNEWKVACDAAIEAVRGRSERRDAARSRVQGKLKMLKGGVGGGVV